MELTASVKDAVGRVKWKGGREDGGGTTREKKKLHPLYEAPTHERFLWRAAPTTPIV